MNITMDIGMIAVWIVTLLPYIISIAKKTYSKSIRIIWMFVTIVLPILTLLIILKIMD